MNKSLGHDQFSAIIVGNLVTEPRLLEDEEGNKACFCTVATNPRSRKFDPRSGKEMTPDQRNKRRSFVELKIVKTSAAEKFANMFSQGDRIRVEGEVGTKKIVKAVWSEKQQKAVPLKVDVDRDRKNIQEIYEDRFVMWVDSFSKVLRDEGLEVAGPMGGTLNHNGIRLIGSVRRNSRSSSEAG